MKTFQSRLARTDLQGQTCKDRLARTDLQGQTCKDRLARTSSFSRFYDEYYEYRLSDNVFREVKDNQHMAKKSKCKKNR